MKDKAIQGLSEANTKNRLANDAEVAKRNKENVGRRNDYKNSLSMTSTSSASPFFNSVKSNVSGSTNLTGANKNLEAKKRLNKVNKNLKALEKIPISTVQAAAKAARASKIIEEASQKKGGFFKNSFGNFNSNKDKISDAEKEAALAADARGEEYNSEDVEENYTIKLDKNFKRVLFAIVGPAIISSLFICVIFISVIPASADKAYLETTENPTEEELEQHYIAAESDE